MSESARPSEGVGGSPFKKLGEREGYYVHWHWYIDRLADVAVAHMRGAITDDEAAAAKRHYEWLWLRAPDGFV